MLKYLSNNWSRSSCDCGILGACMDLQLLKSCRSPVWWMSKMSLASLCEKSSSWWWPSWSVAGSSPCLTASFLYWTMFLKAAGSNGREALVIGLVDRKDGLGHGEVVVEPRSVFKVDMKGCMYKQVWGSQTRLLEREGEPIKAGGCWLCKVYLRN